MTHTVDSIMELVDALVEAYRYGATTSERDESRAALHTALQEFAAEKGEPVAYQHQWDSSGERCLKCGDKDWMGGSCSKPDAAPQPAQEIPLPMETAPRDGTIIRLLVEFENNSLEDDVKPVWTIGENSFNNTQIDEWRFAGWNWCHDHFTQGEGKPVAWLPMLSAAPQPAQPSEPAQPEQGPST